MVKQDFKLLRDIILRKHVGMELGYMMILTGLWYAIVKVMHCCEFEANN